MIDEFDALISKLQGSRGIIAKYSTAMQEYNQLLNNVEATKRDLARLNTQVKEINTVIDRERQNALRDHTKELEQKHQELTRINSLIGEAQTELKELQTKSFETYNKHETLKKQVNKLERSIA
jgi:chromosome segregation ATPase